MKLELEKRIEKVMKEKDIEKRYGGLEELAKTCSLQELRRCLRNKNYFISEGAARLLRYKAEHGLDCSSAVADLIVAINNGSRSATFVLIAIGLPALPLLLRYLYNYNCDDYDKRAEIVYAVEGILKKNSII